MKKNLLYLLAAGLSGTAFLPAADTVKLDQPDLERGAPIMKALSDRQSIRSFSEKALSQKDLSDLLWAANGINRQESGKRTAPSAMNRQDVKIYICTKNASYLYDHKAHAMIPVNDGDVRPADAPYVSFLERIRRNPGLPWTPALSPRTSPCSAPGRDWLPIRAPA